MPSLLSVHPPVAERVSHADKCVYLKAVDLFVIDLDFTILYNSKLNIPHQHRQSEIRGNSAVCPRKITVDFVAG